MSLTGFIPIERPESAPMSSKKSLQDAGRQDQIITEARRSRELREKDYRERALKMYPHICARCGREFSGKKLRELTVHHKDHNHDNNPPDGGNWELLCLYCHDNEHQEYLDKESFGTTTPGRDAGQPSTYKPFAALGDLLMSRKKTKD
jgi:predicted Zn-ribbon and HTH transcriptional regulator